MRRIGRSVRVAVVVGMALLPGAALAQTTTSSSSSTSSSSTSTVAPTTTTTQAHPCTGQPCTADPPGVVLSTPSVQIEADRGSYCWRRPTEPTGFCVALSRAPGYQPPLLVVTEGEVVTVRFTGPVPGTPQQVLLADNGALTPLAATSPTSFRVDLAPGINENLAIITRWLQGEVPHVFRLDVRRATTPPVPNDGRRITLTG
jgi:hypothetical protein